MSAQRTLRVSPDWTKFKQYRSMCSDRLGIAVNVARLGERSADLFIDIVRFPPYRSPVRRAATEQQATSEEAGAPNSGLVGDPSLSNQRCAKREDANRRRARVSRNYQFKARWYELWANWPSWVTAPLLTATPVAKSSKMHISGE